MIQERIIGNITDIDEAGKVTISATLPNLDRALLRQYGKVEVILPDGRRISPEQRRKIFALIGEVAEYVDGIKTDSTIQSNKEMLKWEFILKTMEGQERRLFSLSNCDMSTAREFITYLVSFIVENGIPTSVSLIDNCEDIGRYVYACLINKKCCVCGKKAQLHHVQSVGSQGYRDKINHIGLEALPLCADHHTESHTIGQESFMGKYHLKPVIIDKKIAQIYKLKSK